MKNLICYLSLILLFGGCMHQRENQAVIETRISGLNHRMIRLFRINPEGLIVVDSAFSDARGQVRFTVAPVGCVFYKLDLGERNGIFLALKENDQVEIAADLKDIMHSVIITGGCDEKRLTVFNRFLLTNDILMDSLTANLRAGMLQPNYTVIRTQLDSVFTVRFQQQKFVLQDLILSAPENLTSLLMLNCYFGSEPFFTLEKDHTVFRKLDTTLHSVYSDNEYYRAFQKLVNNIPGKQIPLRPESILGNSASDFELPDISGKRFRLSGMKDKFVLLVFWASWNEQSRRLNKELASAYSEFKSRGFGIISVSLEDNQQYWKRAVQDDKAYWKHVIDSSGLNSGIAKQYAVQNLPTCILLDKEKKIVAFLITPQELKVFLRNKL